MSAHLFRMLRILRERREQRSREALELCRGKEYESRNAVTSAQRELDDEKAVRLAFAAQWRPQGGGVSNVSDQMSARTHLIRLDGVVEKHLRLLETAQSALVAAENATEASAAELKAAQSAREKSLRNFERHLESMRQEQMWVDETEDEEEAEIQVMTRFIGSGIL